MSEKAFRNDLKIDMHVGRMVFPVYGKARFIQQAIGTGMAVLGQRGGTRVEQINAVLFISGWNVGVAGEEHIARLQGRKMIRPVDVAMAHENSAAVPGQDVVIAHHGEFKNHLVDFRFAVAPNGDDLILQGIHDGNDLFGRVGSRQVIAGSVVKNVAEAENHVGMMNLNGVKKQLRSVQSAMDI